MQDWIVWNRTLYIYIYIYIYIYMDLVLNIQWLICHKTKPPKSGCPWYNNKLDHGKAQVPVSRVLHCHYPLWFRLVVRIRVLLLEVGSQLLVKVNYSHSRGLYGKKNWNKYTKKCKYGHTLKTLFKPPSLE